MSRNNKLTWGEKEIGFLRTHYKDMTYEQMAAHFGVSTSTVGIRCRMMGLVCPKKRCIDWTEERLRYLKENFAEVSASDIADKLGVSCSAVSVKARELGLKKSPEWNKQLYRDRYIRNYRHTA